MASRAQRRRQMTRGGASCMLKEAPKEGSDVNINRFEVASKREQSLDVQALARNCC